MPTPPPHDATPKSLFASWLERAEAGEETDLEELCRNHPEHAAGLRSLHARWLRLQGAMPPLEDAGTMSSGHGTRPPPAPASAGPGPAGLPPEVLSRLLAKPPASARYRPRGEVARGGMGTVLRVWDEELNRHLAMKVLHEKDDVRARGYTPGRDPRLLARFLEEAQITGQLDHPGIVPVHELGLDAEGRVFFTMKLVEGKTLHEVFDEYARGEGGWTRTGVLRLLSRLCEAMAYAHHKGVIHRDLKPANVMVGRFGEVYVMDWGLAKVLGREEAGDARLRVAAPDASASAREEERADAPDSPLLTMEGDVVGTPAYMPPEQALGDLGAMGPHSDVYAVGAMLYHLLAGHMPYVSPGKTPSSRRVWALVQAGPPAPLGKVAPAAPAELVAVCEKAMAREITARYPDMSALAAELSAYLEGRVVSAYETGAWAEARKWVRRNRALATSLAAAVSLLVAGLVTAMVLRQQAVDSEAVARKRADDVLGLSAFRTLEHLEEQARSLWPPHPEHLEAYDAWIDEAEALVAGLDPDPLTGDAGHRARLEALRARALPSDPAEREPGASRTWRFASEEDAWWHTELVRLIAELETLQDPEVGLWKGDPPGVGWGVEHRRDAAAEVERRSLTDPDVIAAWDAAARRVAASSKYEGVALSPQLGLVPLGPDPDSGLEEFGHPLTGTIPERDAAGRLRIGEETGLVFVLLRGGTFHMGAQSEHPEEPNYDPGAFPEEGPVHEVTLPPFFLSKYEMTQGQWARFAGDRPSRNGPVDPAAVDDPLVHPVERVSPSRCIEVCERMGLSLPSEAQWEYGARGGTDTPWWTGDTPRTLDGAANLADLSLREADPKLLTLPWLRDDAAGHARVGTYAPNPFGLHDVHGNVMEWCRDRIRPHGSEVQGGPVGEGASWALDHVRRGGGYKDNPRLARSAQCISRRNPSYVDSVTGLRPARELRVP